MNFLKWLVDIVFGWVPYMPKAIWNMWSLDRNGTTWYKIRAFALLCIGTWVILDGFDSYKDYQDFSLRYPKYNELNVDEGNLTKMRYGKGQYDLTLIKSDNTRIHINQKYGLYSVVEDWFHGKNHAMLDITVPVTIRWFVLPSGTAWIVELERDGNKVISYQKAKDDFYKTKNYVTNITFFWFWIPLFLLLTIIYFEASALRKNTYLGEK